MKRATLILLALVLSGCGGGVSVPTSDLWVVNATDGVLVDVRLSHAVDGPVVHTLEGVLPGERRFLGSVVDAGYCYRARCAETGCLMFGCGVAPEIVIGQTP